jgi:hypothetical protein
MANEGFLERLEKRVDQVKMDFPVHQVSLVLRDRLDQRDRLGQRDHQEKMEEEATTTSKSVLLLMALRIPDLPDSTIMMTTKT